MSKWDGPLATLMLPNVTGGANWQGGSFDPETGIFYIFAVGTSAASPHAAGVAALVEGRAGGGLTAGQLRMRIEQSADDLGKPGVDLVYSHGRINAFRAVTQ